MANLNISPSRAKEILNRHRDEGRALDHSGSVVMNGAKLEAWRLERTRWINLTKVALEFVYAMPSEAEEFERATHTTGFLYKLADEQQLAHLLSSVKRGTSVLISLEERLEYYVELFSINSQPVLGANREETNDATSSPEDRDIFISHASEDKDTIVRPLSKTLMAKGWSVWVDELELTIGDSLSRRIDLALVRSRFGVVILSSAFFAKPWPQRELSGLAAKEMDGTKVILPVWHGVDHRDIAQYSPPLADRLGVRTSAGIDEVARQISLALNHAGIHTSPSATGPVEPAAAPWRAIHGGGLESLFVGAHVIDQKTGQRGQVEQVLGPRSAVVRLEDGTQARISPG